MLRGRGKRAAARRVLVIEDDQLHAKLFCYLLQAHGYLVELVGDEREALDHAHRFRPDLVIVDIRLPIISGLDVIRLLRADELLQQVPIMAVTVLRGELEILEAGADSYVRKPISVAEFPEQVAAMLTQRFRAPGD